MTKTTIAVQTIDKAVKTAPGLAAHGNCVRAYEEIAKAYYYHGTRVGLPGFNAERSRIVRAQDKVDARCKRQCRAK